MPALVFLALVLCAAAVAWWAVGTIASVTLGTVFGWGVFYALGYVTGLTSQWLERRRYR